MSSHSHFHGVVLPPSLLTHCSERTCAPTHTPMVSYYHQVFSHTHSHTVFSLTHTPMVSYYHQVITHPHQSLCSHSLPSTMSSHTLLPSLHFTSFSLQMHHQCITNASPMHHQCITNASPTISHTLPPIMPPSHHHHFLSPITTNHHQSLPLTPYNTPNPSISLPTLPIVS